MVWYHITDWLGLVPLAMAFAYAVIGLFKLIKRKSLFKVDKEILALGVFYGGALLWVHKFFMALLFVTLVLACCFVLVMAEVFHQANQFKEENDMTI